MCNKAYRTFCFRKPLAGQVSNLSPIKMSKSKANYFDMELQTVSGEGKRVVCFTKQRYDLFRKINESQTELVVIKKLRIQNDDILITDYTKVNISAITQCLTKDLKIANIATVLGGAALYDTFNIQVTVSL